MSCLDWSRIYTDHYDLVFRIVYYRSGCNRQLAEDLAQDVFVRAIRAERQWTDDGRGIGPWLSIIARHLHMDHVKSCRSRREVTTGEMRDVPSEVAPSAEDVALVALEAADLTWEVEQAMADLTEPQQRAIRLQYWEDQPLAAIAERMGRNVGAVKTLAYRGRLTLARQLSPAA